ncbi:hypothetical protein IMZ31_24040 (plasmid) [Pontibacillus sp. ALD_SL1]|uniref:hypothetical protein n=1 Tax=Pontibacillus sp. ALD_SL1 TaxID=2777185 RepID=UPI001A970CB3|nr:hypothetical protein [Pontibacillus sp. ALD_SL1]QST02524.1 hypothetical protein IMZ31_24040 [Pontibacillus sp. ALD_SL1]
MRQMYNQGYNGGLPFLISLILIGLFIFFIEPIVQFSTFIGLTDFFREIGVVTNHSGDTLDRFGLFFIVLFLFFLALCLVALLLFSLSDFLGYVVFGLICVVFLPLLLLLYASASLGLLIFGGRKGSPRWKRNSFGKNKIPLSDVLGNINRMPCEDDDFFYIGITKDNRDYLILPQLKEADQDHSLLKCQRMDLTIPHNDHRRLTDDDIQDISSTEFQYFLEQRKSQDYKNFFKDYAKEVEYREQTQLLSYPEYIESERKKHNGGPIPE